MPEPRAPTAPIVYQLRVVLRHLSPLIWRRLLVRSDSIIADLHATLRLVLGWSDEHLHRFIIQGRVYGTDGRADPRRVHLADLGLRVRGRFLYEYDFTDGWQHDVRVEQILPLELGCRYPLCIGGRRAMRLRRSMGVSGTSPALLGRQHCRAAAGVAQAHQLRRRPR